MKRPKINEKEAGVGPIFLKKTKRQKKDPDTGNIKTQETRKYRDIRNNVYRANYEET